MKLLPLLTLLTLLTSCNQSVLIEAESFDDPGGWVIDPQFVEQMGSPYLMAHGLGEPVGDAVTVTEEIEPGYWHIWVRTKNWAPGDWEAPGRFQVVLNDEVLPEILGDEPGWDWEYTGKVEITSIPVEIKLRDLTGFNARADAICFSKSKAKPPVDLDNLKRWRKRVLSEPALPKERASFDLVVVGGGLAGCAAAIAAAEQGLQVALIQDRPVLGGNASGEIRVHTEGIYGHFERILRQLDTEHYPNGHPDAHKEDEKRMLAVTRQPNIHLYLNWRAYQTETRDGLISAVDAKHTSSGALMRFEAPLFVDCTGDGWIGYWSGADYTYGRESVHEYGEAWSDWGEIWSPETPDSAIMGASVLWRSTLINHPTPFPSHPHSLSPPAPQSHGPNPQSPDLPWATAISGDFAARNGTWNWEYISRDLHQINDGEEIRDHMLRAIFGSFFNEKLKPGTDSLELEWVSYLLGKRESRRLLGDYIYTFNDERENRQFPDSVVVEERVVDVHYPQKLINPAIPDFLTEAMYYQAGRYYVPYRCLYSRNIHNLFMAGRCFSTSHVGLGGPRVMRTTGQMGAAVGLAAALCKKYSITPRQVYEKHLAEYMGMVTK